MGCATSKMISLGLASNKQGTPYKFWPLGCSKIEDISMHIGKCTGNTTLSMMERESNLTNHRLLNPQHPHDQNLSLDRHQSVSSANSISRKENKNINHSSNNNAELLLSIGEKEEKEMINNADDCMVRNHEETNNNSDSYDHHEEQEEGQDDFRKCPCSPSFKVYIKACNIIDKTDGSNKETKLDNMKVDKNLTKMEQVKQLQNEDPTLTSNPTPGEVKNSLNKSNKGKRFQRPTIKSFIGVVTRSASIKHRKSSSNKDSNPAKVKVE